jgi:dihydrofolate reductase
MSPVTFVRNNNQTRTLLKETTSMGKLIVVQFVTLDGVVEDPDGSDHTEFGGWAMRHGPQGVAGDKFRLGSIMERGTLLFGRRTWEHFTTLWPTRTDPFSQAMNAATKAVLTRHQINLDAWTNSHVVDQPLEAWVKVVLATNDIVVIGSGSVVDALANANLIDEYRLLIFPFAAGTGRRLFTTEQRLELVTAEQVGPAALCVLTPQPN